MKVKDLQFIRHLFTNEINIGAEESQKAFNIDLEVKLDGEPDRIIDRGNKIVYHQPSSITKFLFQTSYSVLSHLVNDQTKDKMGLALLGACREYVSSDYQQYTEGPPVVIDYDKIPVPKFILSEIVEPILGKIDRRPVMFYPCKFTDVCRWVETRDELSREYSVSLQSVPVTDFPILVVNSNIHNQAARYAVLIC